MVGSAISKRMQLLVEWADKGFQAGIEKDKRGLDEIKKRALSVAKAMLAATAAIVGLTAGLLKLIKQGSEVKSVQESFEGFVRAAKMSPDTLDKVRESVRGTISNLKLMQASVRGLSAGLDPGRIVEFWQKSKQIADVSSQDTLMVFESLIMGMTKLEVETLKTIGITIRAEDVYKDYAASIDKTQAQLTTYDKQVAFSIALEEKYRKNFMSVGDVTTRVREKFQQLGAGVKNVWNKFVVMIAESPKVQKFLGMLIDYTGEAKTKLDEIEPKIQSTTDAFITLLERSQQTAKALYSARVAIIAVGLGFATAKLANWIAGIVVALKTVGPAAMSVGGWIGIAVAAIIALVVYYKDITKGIVHVLSWVARMSVTFAQTMLKAIAGLLDKISSPIETATNKILGFVRTILEKLAWLAGKVPGIGADMKEGLLSAAAGIEDVKFGTKWQDELRKASEGLENTKASIYLAGEGFKQTIDGWPEFNIWSTLFPKDKQDASVVEREKREAGGLWEGYSDAQAAGMQRAKEQAAQMQFFAAPKLEIPKPIYPKLEPLKMPKVPPLHIPDPIYPAVMALKIPRPRFEGEWPVQVPAPIYEQYVPPTIAPPILPKIPAIEIPRPVGMDQAERDIEYYKETIMSLKDTSETVPYFREKYNIPEPVMEAKAPKRDREQLAMLDEEEQAFLDSWDRRVEYAQSSSDILLSIEEGRYLSNAELWEMERVDFLRNMQMRERAYSAGYQAMGQYSDRFFNRNAKLARVLNAMLIRGATEAVAAFIDAKGEEARYQFAANTYEMFAALARKDFYAAGLFGKAAVGWGALAGGAALASGGVRYAGQQKAEGMMAEQETQWEEATTGDGEEMGRQKREASGVVNARPIHINVYSTANFNSGYMIFGDSETAANELYEERFRSRIESDIESGEIQV